METIQIDGLPANYRIERPVMDDLKAVTELTIACDIAEIGRPESSEEDIRNRWQVDGFDLSRDAWIVRNADGRVIAYVGVGHREVVRMHTSPCIHPDYFDPALARTLLRLAEARGRELLSEAPAGVRVTLNSWCAETNEALQRVLEGEGFAHVRSNWRMEIKMSEPPLAPTWPEGIALRPFKEDMARQVFEAFDEAFLDHWGHIPGNYELWSYWVFKLPGVDHSLFFIAFDGDQIAGLSMCGIENGIGYVGDLAVRRPWRQKGLGQALLLHSFGEFYRRGMPHVELNVDSQNLTGATRLYERVGMHRAYQFNQFEKELRSGVDPGVQALKA